MTSYELREKCIEAMAKGITEHMAKDAWRYWLKESAAAFDALHGIVRVVPMYSTTDMVAATANRMLTDSRRLIFDEMAAAGDLTRTK